MIQKDSVVEIFVIDNFCCIFQESCRSMLIIDGKPLLQLTASLSLKLKDRFVIAGNLYCFILWLEILLFRYGLPYISF
jgi:hypothetical protein